jgi:hypothetical protein
MIYRGPSYLVVMRFGSSPTHPLPPLSPVSKFDRRHTGRLRKRGSLMAGEGEWAGDGLGADSFGSLVLYESFNTLCSTHCTTTWHKLANRGVVCKQGEGSCVQKTPLSMHNLHSWRPTCGRLCGVCVCYQNMFQKLAFCAGLSQMLYDKYGSHSVKKGHMRGWFYGKYGMVSKLVKFLCFYLYL